MALEQEQCEPCRGGTPPLGPEEAQALAVQTPLWTLGEKSITREFRFADFRQAMSFVDKLAELAEAQGHHPDIKIVYNRVKLELSTHKIGGLSRNDFIIAAKIDTLVGDAAS